MNKALPVAILSIALTAAGSFGQTADASNQYVTRDEYNKLLQELQTMKAQLQATQSTVKEQKSENEDTFNDYDKQLKDVSAKVKKASSGSSEFLITGYGAGTFQTTSSNYGPAQGDDISTDGRSKTTAFSASFSPILLWKLNDRVLFESELSGEVAKGGESSIELEYLQATYAVNDYLTIGAGKFLNPVNVFVERLHPWWMDKLPDRPLAVFDGLLPESIVGAEARGGIPIGNSKFEYALFIGSSPKFAAADNPMMAGTLDMEGLSTDRVSPGGRIGYFIVPNLEIGYGLQAPNLGNGVGALFQTVDLNYQQDALKGTFDVKGEWVWANLDPYTVDSGTGAVVPLQDGVNNHRNGGYAQISYRPSKLAGFLKDTEFVFRYDAIKLGTTALSFDEGRYAFGVDYWITPSSVMKAGYDIDHQNGTGHNGNALTFQYAIGF